MAYLVFYGLLAMIIGFLTIRPLLSFVRRKCIVGDAGKNSLYGGKAATEFNKIHGEDEKIIPRMGGLVLFLPIVITTIIFITYNLNYYNLEVIFKSDFMLVFATWIIGFIFGLYLDIKVLMRREVRLRTRILLVGVVSIIFGYLFSLLGLSSIYIPFIGELTGIFWVILFVVLVHMSLYAATIIDGVDGLSHSVFAIIIATYGAMNYIVTGSADTLFFSVVIVGAIIPFLYYNLPPAKWYAGETGVMSLAFGLSGIVFSSELLGAPAVSLLPFIGIMLVVTVGSVILQGISKKYRGKKIWKSTPIHHHFETIMPSASVTMMYIIITLIVSMIALLLVL